MNAADQTALPGVSFDAATLSYDFTAPNDVSARNADADRGEYQRAASAPPLARPRQLCSQAGAASARICRKAFLSLSALRSTPRTVRFPRLTPWCSPASRIRCASVPRRAIVITRALRRRSSCLWRAAAFRRIPTLLRTSSVSGVLPEEFSYDADTRALTVHLPGRLAGLFQQVLLYRVTDSSVTARQTEQEGYTIMVRSPVEFAEAVPPALTFQYNTAGSRNPARAPLRLFAAQLCATRRRVADRSEFHCLLACSRRHADAKRAV